MTRSDAHSVSLRVNGDERSVQIESRRTLAEVLREELGLTGTHLGCEHGVCGACTVMLDGDAVRSCLVLGVQAAGHDVVTVEGLATDDRLDPVQQGMWERHGFQCAFCAPGVLVSVRCLLNENPTPTREQIREELSGNLCRCTGYASILAGVEAAIACEADTTQEDEDDA